jgi:hypothetical protein
VAAQDPGLAPAADDSGAFDHARILIRNPPLRVNPARRDGILRLERPALASTAVGTVHSPPWPSSAGGATS